MLLFARARQGLGLLEWMREVNIVCWLGLGREEEVGDGFGVGRAERKSKMGAAVGRAGLHVWKAHDRSIISVLEAFGRITDTVIARGGARP